MSTHFGRLGLNRSKRKRSTAGTRPPAVSSTGASSRRLRRRHKRPLHMESRSKTGYCGVVSYGNASPSCCITFADVGWNVELNDMTPAVLDDEEAVVSAARCASMI